MNDLPVAVKRLPAKLTPAPPAERNPALVYLAALSAGSRPAMRGALAAIAAIVAGADADVVTFPWHTLRYQHTAAIRVALAETHAPATVNKMLSALRGVLRSAWRLGLMDADTYQRAIDMPRARGSLPSAAETGRHLTMGELAALMGACVGDGTDAGIRDAAIIALGYSCGLRRAELAGLTVGDYDAASHALNVRGKGAKTRVVYVENGARAALGDWLALRGGHAGPLFLAFRRGDHVTDGGLTVGAIHLIIRRRAEAAAVPPFTPHDLRRTFAGDLLDAGADIVTVQKMMGHASPTTTAGYDRRDTTAKQRAATKLHVPYQSDRA